MDSRQPTADESKVESVLTDGEGLEVLAAEQCLELMTTSRLGRIAVTIGAVPAIFPVAYRLLDGQIIFRAGVGTNLHRAAANKVVAFEVDDVDLSTREGWSVVAVGMAREVKDHDAVSPDVDGAPRLWEPSSGSHVIVIMPAFLSGRRFVPAA